MSLFQVLVVDEDPKFTSGVASVLQRASRETGRAKGLVVLRATDIRRAFEVLNRDPVRMVFISGELKGQDPVLLAEQFVQGYGHLPQFVFGRSETDARKMLFLQKGIQRYFRRPVTRSEAMIMFEVIAAYASDVEKNPALIKTASGPPPELPPSTVISPTGADTLHDKSGSGPLQGKPGSASNSASSSGTGSGPVQTLTAADLAALSGASGTFKAGSSKHDNLGSGSVVLPLNKGNDLPDPDHSGNLMANEAIAGLMGEFGEPDLEVLISMDSTILEAPENPEALEELSNLDERLAPALETVGQTIVDILGVQNPSQLQVRTDDRLIVIQINDNARSIALTRDMAASPRSVVKALEARVSEHTNS
jgi:CheY-like chemotaxis protein